MTCDPLFYHTAELKQPRNEDIQDVPGPTHLSTFNTLNCTSEQTKYIWSNTFQWVKRTRRFFTKSYLIMFVFLNILYEKPLPHTLHCLSHKLLNLQLQF